MAGKAASSASFGFSVFEITLPALFFSTCSASDSSPVTVKNDIRSLKFKASAYRQFRERNLGTVLLTDMKPIDQITPLNKKITKIARRLKKAK
jgi:hypothetical protein